MRFAEVAVDSPIGHDRTFSYAIPESLNVRPGHLVKVPFGSRTLQGVVFSLAPVPQVARTRNIQSVESPEPLLTETQLALARWTSNYYMSPLFETAAIMLPPGGRVRSRAYLSLNPAATNYDGLSLTPFQQRVLTYVRNRRGVDQERLIGSLGENARAAASRLVDKEVLLRSFGRSRPGVGRKYGDQAALTSDGRKVLNKETASHAPRQVALLTRLLEDETLLLLSDARKEYGYNVVKAMLDKGWIERQRVPVERDPLAGQTFPPPPPVTLTPRQMAIASEIRAVMEDTSAVPRVFLVQGVTGSGKTEIYLDAVEHCLKLGKKAIVLVPEIALTQQTIERFAARFPGQVALLHSGLSQGERFDQWWKIKRGEYGIVIGSRSALFAPQPDLGLVVMDEEHEWTYKQHDSGPRYHARDVALRLSELTGAAVVLGSASPDVASYYKGLLRELRLLVLPQRFRDAPIPSVDSGQALTLPSRGVKAAPQGSGEGGLASVNVVDMRRELREGNRDIFSRRLVSAMNECLDSGGQMILFLNRRGSAGYMQCRNCGFGLRCRRCDIALTYHKEGERLICHYCGYQRRAPTKCPSCLGYRMGHYGIGTQSVERRVKERFPQATVFRWDSDTARRPKDYQILLERFRSGEGQVLVGTQMIAKGLHFPTVTLVGVVSADVGLNIPDYRAGERAFQLLCQVAGRAGRGQEAGNVVIQTYQPDNYAIQAAALQDYQRFYTKEMAFRREHADPPYGKIIRLLYTHTNMALCEREARRFSKLLEEQRDAWGYSDIELLGPTPAYPARLRGRYRWHLILRSPEPRALLDTVVVPQGWAVDIDPVALT